ncbi:MAG: glycerol dehydrogenase [Planctomycetaceae bacterium]|nr:glycerol dehydrogenase [Planctomycetaceae bacterium]
MLAVFTAPARYVQGKDATESLGREMQTVGLTGPALVVAGASAAKLLAPVWERTFQAAGIAYSVHLFAGESSVSEIDRIAAEAKKFGAAVVIGAGGGKVLDATRAAADALHLPVVCCPTVVSTDAPCSALSVIYTDDGVFQEYRFYRRNPELVLVDTQVVAQSPPRLFVAGMGDALSTYFEAKTCADARRKNMRGGTTTLAALALAELCYRTVLADGVAALRALEAKAVTPALERVAEANTLLSGLGFESSGLAAAHAVHNGMTAAPETHDYLHGEKVAFGTLVQLVLEGRPQPVIDELIGFCDAVGLPTTLAEIGLTSPKPGVIEQIAVRACAAGETIHNLPFVVTPSAVADAIRAADALGRAAKATQRS